jgi:hypothetical protein
MTPEELELLHKNSFPGRHPIIAYIVVGAAMLGLFALLAYVMGW